MVTRQILVLFIGVQIPASQPIYLPAPTARRAAKGLRPVLLEEVVQIGHQNPMSRQAA